jgi:hypothetical protein
MSNLQTMAAQPARDRIAALPTLAGRSIAVRLAASALFGVFRSCSSRA